MRNFDSTWFSLCGVTDEGVLLKNLAAIQQDLIHGKFAQYAQQERTAAAYAAYYLPTNYPKLDFVLGQLNPTLRARLGQMQLIDFGCGPGTFSLAWQDAFGEEAACYLLDRSWAMLTTAQKILKTLYPQRANHFFTKLTDLAAQLSPAPRCLFFGHGLIEMATEVNWPSVFKLLKPEVLILIEPGTKASFQNLKNWRQWPQEQGFKIIYPCLGPHSCPLKSDDWCHQVLHYTQPAAWQRLGQKLGLDRNELPLIAQVWAKNDGAAEAAAAITQTVTSLQSTASSVHYGRLMRVWGEDKAYFRWQLCCAIDGKFCLPKVEVAKRHLAKEQQKAWHHLASGSLIYFKIAKINGNQTWRIEVLAIQ